MGSNIRLSTLAAALIFTALTASAHHSTAFYGQQHDVTLQGVVTAFHWVNPHVLIDVAVPNDGGEFVTWSIEAAPPRLLTTTGWSSTSLAIGDHVVVIAAPSISPGGNIALAKSVRMADGTLLAMPGDPSEVSASVRVSAPQSSCPRVEMTLIEASASSETRAVRLGDETISVRRNGITTTNDMAEIEIAGDDALALIQIKYNPEAGDLLFDATSNRDDLKIAFVVDDEVWLAFTWEGPYGIGRDGTQISLENGMDRAQRLVDAIRECNDE